MTPTRKAEQKLLIKKLYRMQGEIELLEEFARGMPDEERMKKRSERMRAHILYFIHKIKSDY